MEMGDGGNQPIITQQSFKSSLPKLFPHCFSSSSAQPCAPRPSTFIPLSWMRLSLCCCHDLGVAVVVICWTGRPSRLHASCTAQTRRQRCSQPFLCFLVSATSQTKKKNRMRLSYGLKVFTWFEFSEGLLVESYKS
ncbi:hypothetical protein JOB18_040754 [Solea senegalensis]|uniref:Uncharacterized protein n=1 Tax=Solea senegalensis TaxID=28829 RepID=A0AAV6QMT2_SOLSE|nr:hypothetical protein JOB18_040754 [Solea senegalensis]